VAGRDHDAVQLRAVAPLVDATTRQLLGPVMLVTNGQKTIGITNSEILRAWEPSRLAIATALDGSALVPVANWYLGRYSGVGLVELAPIESFTDLTPLPIGAVCATAETRGAPSALVTIVAKDGGFAREVIPVHVDASDAGGMSDEVTRLASPIEPMHVGHEIEGAVLFSWFPPDPVLGRKSEVLAVAIAYPYTLGILKPRDLPPFAELLGLDDLGRALIQSAQEVKPEDRPELHTVTGEIAEVRGGDRAVLDPVEEIRKQRESK
jgi:hypothetical protein